jgi:hypothetical protein
MFLNLVVVKNLKFALVVFNIIFFTHVFSQNGLVTAGGEATGSGGSLSSSIGQVFYTSNESNNGIVSQGVQQAYEINPVGIDETTIERFAVFPNPTVNKLIIKCIFQNGETINFQLIDNKGKVLQAGNLLDGETELDFSVLASSVYFITLLNKESMISHHYKVIKN